MRTDWENVRPDMAVERNWYRQLQAAYMNQIETVYTRVPSEILPRLSALVEANPLTDTEEITAFILYTLHSRASYSLTPGRMPLNGEDVAEYFLFEGHSGYCVHFAAAATLMYRLYGVPARYVSGYAATPEDFSRSGRTEAGMPCSPMRRHTPGRRFFCRDTGGRRWKSRLRRPAI